MGNLDHVVDPAGTITDTTFDGQGRQQSVQEGTNDTTSNNMMTVENDYYDQRQTAPPTGTVTLGQTPGGTMPATTYYVEVTYVNLSGQSVASTEMTQSVASDELLTVKISASVAGALGSTFTCRPARAPSNSRRTHPRRLT